MPRDPLALTDDVRESLKLALLGPDGRVIVGLSGGVDSLTLTHVLVSLRNAGEGPSVRAVHVDHGLRPESERDAREVERLARKLDVPIDVARVDVAQWDVDRGRGIEAVARAARYAILARAARDVGADWIVLGHTLDDQAETIIFRLARGTSLDGLAGMREISTRAVEVDPEGHEQITVKLLRPLLHCRRSEIEDYAAHHRLIAVEDESNADMRYRRNAIRHQFLPQLEQIVPGATESISRAADLLADDADFLSNLVDDAFRDISDQLGDCVALNRDAMRALHTAVQRRLIAKAVFALASGIQLTAERIEALRRAASGGTVSTTIEIGGSLAAYVDYDRLVIGPANVIEFSLRASAALPVLDKEEVVHLSHGETVHLGEQWDLVIQSDEDLDGWEIRTRRPGDRLALSSAHTKRLQDWFVDRKVPSYMRDCVPLLVHRDTVRWILGFSSKVFEDVDSGITARLRERSVEVHGYGEHDSGHQAPYGAGTHSHR